MHRPLPRHRWLVLLLLVFPLLSACSAGVGRYRLPSEAALARQQPIADAGPRLEQGRPIAALDGLNHYVLSLPTKLLLWDWQVLDHRLPEESERLLDDYLELNEMRSVKVRHNQYAPGSEFGRLLRNREVSAGYRYTLGIFSWLRYTLLPDRLLAGLPLIGGGDHFNPFSNTIHVYSSDAGVLLHEAGHAKDYLNARWKGTYMGLLRLVPFVNLWHEAVASDDALRFLKCAQAFDAESDAYTVLFPAYATYVSGYFVSEAQIPLLIGGHVAGRVQARRRERAVDRAIRSEDPTLLAQVLGDGTCGAVAPELDARSGEGADGAGPAEDDPTEWSDPQEVRD